MHFRLLILTILFLSFNQSYAQIKNLRTTRLIGTGGAGTASLLVHEAAILNPASIVFFNSSSIYYQKWTSPLADKSDQRTKDYREGRGENIILTDTSSSLKGSLAYQQYHVYDISRTRFSTSFAAPIGKKTALGVIYRYTKDKIDGEKQDTKHQGVLGLTHVFNPRLILGATIEDPFLSDKDDAISTLGLQFSVTQSLVLIGDIGSNYVYDISERAFNRLGAQFNIFKDFYVRAGTFYDRNDQEKGTAYGISWVGPKLSLEYAFKKAEFIGEDTDYIFKGEKFEEVSFSISINM